MYGRSRTPFKIKDTNDEMAALARIQACIGELKAWMTYHRLQLNDDKTEVLVITTPSSASKLSLTDVVIGDSILQPIAVARNIGVMFDSELSMKSRVETVQGSILSPTSDSLHQRLLDTTCH